MSPTPETAVVVIGRNEGDRLVRCLTSLRDQTSAIVYVDSGSADGSATRARTFGVEVVELDRSAPFSAARARNAGFGSASETWPSIRYVQFVDGDCEVDRTWIARAASELDARPEVAVVFGRRRERFPNANLYHRLCDFEWEGGPPGETASCGGDSLMRAAAFQEVGGFNPAVVAGEEPELCVRLRRNGWRVRRIPGEMTLHDAGMTRFAQWWKRMERSGHACAQGMAIHGSLPERFCVRESARIWLWGLGIPAVVVLGVLVAGPWALLGLLLFPAQLVRIARTYRREGRKAADSWLYAAACVVGKWPELQGQIRFRIRRWLARSPEIIEYKGAAATTAAPAREATGICSR